MVMVMVMVMGRSILWLGVDQSALQNVLWFEGSFVTEDGINVRVFESGRELLDCARAHTHT